MRCWLCCHAELRRVLDLNTSNKQQPTVLITGAASGIGAALARAYRNQQAHLVLVDVNPDLPEQWPETTVASDPFVLTKVLDVTDKSAVEKLQQDLCEQGIDVDILIANAGISHITHPDMTTDMVLREIMDVNFYGTTNFILSFLPAMRQRQSGHMVVVSSLAGVRGFPGSAAYAASKAAQANFVESFRVDLQAENIHFTTCYPGFVDTPINQPLEGVQKMPLKMSPEKAAAVIMSAITKKKKTASFPFLAAVVAWLAKLLPPSVFDGVMQLFLVK